MLLSLRFISCLSLIQHVFAWFSVVHISRTQWCQHAKLHHFDTHIKHTYLALDWTDNVLLREFTTNSEASALPKCLEVLSINGNLFIPLKQFWVALLHHLHVLLFKHALWPLVFRRVLRMAMLLIPFCLLTNMLGGLIVNHPMPRDKKLSYVCEIYKVCW